MNTFTCTHKRHWYNSINPALKNIKQYGIAFQKIKACTFVRSDLLFAFFLLASCQNTGEGICRKNGDLSHYNTGRCKKARGKGGKRRIYFSTAWDYWNCAQLICYCFCVHLHYTLMAFLNINCTAHSAKTGDDKNDFQKFKAKSPLVWKDHQKHSRARCLAKGDVSTTAKCICEPRVLNYVKQGRLHPTSYWCKMNSKQQKQRHRFSAIKHAKHKECKQTLETIRIQKEMKYI